MPDEFDSRSRLVSTRPVICQRCIEHECPVLLVMFGRLVPETCSCGCHKRSVEGVF